MYTNSDTYLLKIIKQLYHLLSLYTHKCFKVLLSTVCIKSFNSTDTAMILNIANLFKFTER